jgi:GWxTD domain-containing protein
MGASLWARRQALWRAPRPRRRAGAVLWRGALWGLLAAGGGCGRGATKGEIDFADGLERLALADSSGALDLLQRANYELGGDARVYFHIGRLLAAQPDLESRARAREALLEAVRRAPNTGLYRAELGELLRKQRYLRASTDMAAEAVRLDPSLGHAWCQLGQNLQDDYFLDQDVPALLDSAVACFAHALACDSQDDEARYRLAFLYMHRGEFGRARELLLPAVRDSDCPGRFGLLLSAVEYNASHFAEAQRLVDAGLHCMSPQAREAWIAPAPLLHPDSISAYRILGPAERDSVTQSYWWSLDPTPTTLTNERFVEHVARCVEADFYFSVPWSRRLGRESDRGGVYLRYGKPTVMVRVPAQVPAWEWDYATTGPYARVFRFFDFNLSGDYVRAPGRSMLEFEYIASLPSNTHVAIRNPAPAGDWRQHVRQFRGSGGRTAVDVVYELAAGARIEGLDLEVAAWSGPGQMIGRERTVEACAAMYALDPNRRIGTMRVEFPPGRCVLGLQASALGHAQQGATLGSDPDSAASDAVWVAMERDTLDLAEFDPERIGLSDLVLAHEMRDGSGGMFDRGGVIVVPRTDARIAAEKVLLYFEIYPSRGIQRRRSAVQVRYEVRPLPPRHWSFLDQFRTERRRLHAAAERPVVQATFTLRPTQDIERQQLSIDLGALDPGPYELEVETVDRDTGETAARSVEFDFHPPRPGT